MLMTDHNMKYIDDVKDFDKTQFFNYIVDKYIHNTRYYDEWDIPHFISATPGMDTPGFTDTASDGQTPADYKGTSDIAFYEDIYLLVNRKFNGSTELEASTTMTS